MHRLPNPTVEVHGPKAAASVASHGQRISGLDGLRAVAVSIVFISHYAPVVFPQFPVLVQIFPGMFGVAIFFVISGLLISTLLLREYMETSNISLSNFYIRRILRLSPALLVYVAIFLFAYKIHDRNIDVWAFVTAATYTSNYYQSSVGGELYYMPVWSLAIEEHFYLLFPATLLAFLSRGGRRITLFFAALIILVLVWRCFLSTSGLATFDQIYYNTDTRLDAPLFGVLLAVVMWFSPPESKVKKLVSSTTGLFVGVGIILLTVVIRDEYFRMTFRYTLQGLGILLVVSYIVFDNGLTSGIVRRVLDTKPLVFVGKISYSIYLWHLTTLMFVKHLYPSVTPFLGAVIGVISIGCACLSYYWIERPFLDLRHKFGSHSTI